MWSLLKTKTNTRKNKKVKVVITELPQGDDSSTDRTQISVHHQGMKGRGKFMSSLAIEYFIQKFQSSPYTFTLINKSDGLFGKVSSGSERILIVYASAEKFDDLLDILTPAKYSQSTTSQKNIVPFKLVGS